MSSYCSSSAAVGKILRSTVLARTCPITGGCATRMRRDTFSRMCSAVRVDVMRGAGRCVACKGQLVPDEITFITKGREMARADQMGECALCGSRATLRQNHGVMACPSCQHIQASVKNRPTAVLRVIEAMCPDLLGRGGSDSATAAELEAIAVLVGAAEGESLQDKVKLAVLAARDGEESRGALSVICKALGCAHLLPHEAATEVLRAIAEMSASLSRVSGKVAEFAAKNAELNERAVSIDEEWSPAIVADSATFTLSAEREALADFGLKVIRGEIRMVVA